MAMVAISQISDNDSLQPVGSVVGTRISRSVAREEALKFLYKCEIDKIFYYSSVVFECHCASLGIEGKVKLLAQEYVRGVMDQLATIDARIHAVAANWSMERMSCTDRSVLRLACFELLQGQRPEKVVLNEAIELAKKFGSAHSGKFVNGILDAVKTH